jgi:tetratricopeptide (TPR) repeat protein
MLPEALQTFEQSVKIAETAEAYNDKGLVLRRMGRMPEAQVAFNESLRVAPQFRDAAANSKLPAEDGKKSEPVPDPMPQPAPPPPPQPVVVGGEAPERMPLAEVTAGYLREMRKIELEALCDSLGLNSRGTKNELTSRILRAKEKARRK